MKTPHFEPNLAISDQCAQLKFGILTSRHPKAHVLTWKYYKKVIQHINIWVLQVPKFRQKTQIYKNGLFSTTSREFGFFALNINVLYQDTLKNPHSKNRQLNHLFLRISDGVIWSHPSNRWRKSVVWRQNQTSEDWYQSHPSSRSGNFTNIQR